jgi:hypothetical protein
MRLQKIKNSKIIFVYYKKKILNNITSIYFLMINVKNNLGLVLNRLNQCKEQTFIILFFKVDIILTSK